MDTRSIHDLSAEEIGRFRVDYPSGKLTIREIRERYGLSCSSIYQLVGRLGLERRQVAARHRRAASAVTLVTVPEDEPPALADAAVALERQLVEQLLDLQRRAVEAPPARAELLSKAIANQTRALKSIRDWTAKLNEDRRTDDGTPPRDLGELRDELRRHLERLRAEEPRP